VNQDFSGIERDSPTSGRAKLFLVLVYLVLVLVLVIAAPLIALLLLAAVFLSGGFGAL